LKIGAIGRTAAYAERALRVCSRTNNYFARIDEKNRWVKIAKGIEEENIPVIYVQCAVIGRPEVTAKSFPRFG
jgi:hypothetical protein